MGGEMAIGCRERSFRNPEMTRPTMVVGLGYEGTSKGKYHLSFSLPRCHPLGV